MLGLNDLAAVVGAVLDRRLDPGSAAPLAVALSGGGDSRALARSLRKLAALDGDWTVYPGHGEATILSRERRDNYFLQA